MLPRLERLPAGRVDAHGTARALEVAATCMIALFAVSGVSEVASSDRGALCKTYLHSDPSREAAFFSDGQLRLARQLTVVSPKEQEPNSSTGCSRMTYVTKCDGACIEELCLRAAGCSTDCSR